MVIVPPYVDRIWGIWYMGSHYNIPRAIFYLLKGDYTPLLFLHCPALPAAQAQALTKAGLPQLSRESAAGGSFFFSKLPAKVSVSAVCKVQRTTPPELLDYLNKCLG